MILLEMDAQDANTLDEFEFSERALILKFAGRDNKKRRREADDEEEDGDNNITLTQSQPSQPSKKRARKQTNKSQPSPPVRITKSKGNKTLGVRINRHAITFIQQTNI